jgi:hypothetical protein
MNGPGLEAVTARYRNYKMLFKKTQVECLISKMGLPKLSNPSKN